MLDLQTIDKKLLAAAPAREGKNIITPIARLSYPSLLEARSANPKDPNSKKRFGCSLLIPSQCDISLLKKAAGEAAAGNWGDKAKDLRIKSPFLKAEDYKYEGYLPGWVLIRATCLSKPTVLMQQSGSLVKVTEDNGEEIYPGRWCVVSVNPFAYDTNGNKGVSFGLNNVLLLNHDESLGGRMRAEDEFEAVSGDFDNGKGSTGANASVDDLF